MAFAIGAESAVFQTAAEPKATGVMERAMRIDPTRKIGNLAIHTRFIGLGLSASASTVARIGVSMSPA